MNQGYPLVTLGEVIKLDLDQVRVDPTTTYEMVGVYSFGRGLFRKESVQGNNTSYKYFFRLKATHIVMSQLFGWEGALALSSSKFEGLFVSSQFPTFLCHETRLDRHFLGWLIKRPSFWEDLGTRAKGMGDRRRTLNPNSLLRSTIPLPTLEEQRRIVARFEELMVKVEEVRSLRQKALEETEAFVTSLHLSLADSKIVTLDEILTLDEQQEQVLFGKKYPQVGVKGFGGGLFAKEAIDATQTTYKAFNCLYEGALVLSQVKGWEGAIGICPSNLIGKYVSPEYRTFRCIPGKAIPEYLSALVATPWFWTKLKDLTRGMGGRRERTRPEQFLKMKIPMPTVEYQQKAISIFNKIHNMKLVRLEAIKELDALLPSILDKAFKAEL